MPALMIGADPPEEISKEIYGLKEKVIDICGSQQQADEPPHMTFVVNNFSSAEAVDRYLEMIARRFNPFNVVVNGITHFPHEKSGTYMLHAVIEKSHELQLLQEEIVADTSEFRQGSLLREYLEQNIPDYKYEDKELENIKKWGYPYVGENWEPHITIAILEPECCEKIKEIEETGFRYEFPLNEFTLFSYLRVWKPEKRYKLGKPAP